MKKHFTHTLRFLLFFVLLFHFGKASPAVKITGSEPGRNKTPVYYASVAPAVDALVLKKNPKFRINAPAVGKSSAPLALNTLTFTSDGNWTDGIAEDGEGGSTDISGITIQVRNISSTSGTVISSMSWKDNSFISSTDGTYSALTYAENDGSKGMSIKSADGSEFEINQFTYHNWGETSTITNTVKGYKNGSEVASTTFNFTGSTGSSAPITVSLNSSFDDVDEVRIYISAGGYKGDQSATNHSINNIQLVVPDPPVITDQPDNSNICAGSGTSFSVTATGAVSYQWQGEASAGGGFSNIGVGSPYGTSATTSTLTFATTISTLNNYKYRCVITGAGGTQTISDVAVLGVSAIAANSSSTNETCTGAADGTATISATGGVFPFTYAWEHTSATTSTVTGLTAGTYTGTMTDKYGCEVVKNFTITASPAIDITETTNVSPKCNGGTDGSASVTATGGSGVYTYAWAPSGGSAATATGLAAGTYTVTVSDNAGCSNNIEITVSDPPALDAYIIPYNVTCYGGNDGSIEISAYGGTGVYTYAWSPNVSSSDIATDLYAGSYSVTITDENSCEVTKSYTVTEPGQPSVSMSSTTSPSGCGATDGSIDFQTVNVPDGSYFLDYKENSSATSVVVTVSGNSFTLYDLGAATYTDFVLNFGDCTTSLAGPIDLYDPAVTISFIEKFDPSCFGSDDDGIIAFETNLPDGDYTLNYLKNGSPGSALVSVGCGEFALETGSGTYTDFSITYNGHTASDATSVTLATPPPVTTLAVENQQNPTSCGGTDGEISFSTNLSDGCYPLAYVKDFDLEYTCVTVTSGTFTLSSLSSGDYSDFYLVTETCYATLSTTVTLTEPAGPTLTMGASTNPTTCNGSEGSIAFTTSLANGSYTLEYYEGSTPKTATISVLSGAFTLTGLSAGDYSDFAITVSGCSSYDSGSSTLTDPFAPTLALGASVDPTTCGGTNGIITFTTGLADGSYTLNYSNGSAQTATISVSSGEFTLTGLAAGVYSGFSVTISGCTGTASGFVALTDPGSATLALGSSTDPSTCGGTDGVISFTTSLADGPYTLNYSNGTSQTAVIVVESGGFNLIDLPEGTYTSFSITTGGCTTAISGTSTLTNPAGPALDLDDYVDPSTCGGTDGIISFTTGLDDGSYTLNYSNGTPQSATVVVVSGAFNLTGLPAGDYDSFSITFGGCTISASGSMPLYDPSGLLVVGFDYEDPSTCGGTDGSLTFLTSAADGTYTLTYSNGSAQSASVTVVSGEFILSGLTAGTYSGFTITEGGCTSSPVPPIDLYDPTAATLTLGSAVNPSTCGGTNGSIAFTTSLADGSYTLNYNDGAAKTASITVATGAFTLSGLPAGSYSGFSITVSSCTSSASGSRNLTDPTTATLTLGSSVNPSTCGGTNGSIAFTTTLADGTYTLNYNDGAAKTASVTVASGAFTLSGLPAGSYSSFSITVTGCTSSASGSTTLSDPSTATLTLGSSVNPSTCGGTNGSIAFTTTLADGTYTLNYSDGAAKTASVTVTSGAFTLTGLPAGTYTSFAITVSGCTSSASGSTTLSDPTTATLTLGSSVNPTTCGGTNGSIAFTTSLADGSYTLSYNDGAAKTASVTVASGAFTLSGLPAGSYSSFAITVSGCTSSASGSTTLSDPSTATLTLGSSVNPTTCSGTNGSIAFTTSLADGSYTLNYNDGAAKTASVTVASGAFTLSGLPAGSYSSFAITVSGCTSSASGSTTLSDPTTATLTLGSSVNPSTCGGTNGSIAFTTTLADGTYTLNYSDGAAKTASVTVASGAFTLSGLVAGTYSSFSITVTGCTSSASGSKTLTDPSTATLTLGSSVNPTTCGGTNGSIAFTTTLADGTYTLNYSDGAAKTASVTVASGAFTLTGLPAGTYTSFSITVTGCTSSASGSKTLTDPTTATLTLGSAVNPTTCGGTNGSIAFTTTLADGTYTLNYSDGAAKTASVTVASGAFTLTGLPAGTYTSFSITVTGCTSSASGSKTLTDPTTATLTLGSSVNPSTCGGTNGSIAFTTTLADGTYTLNYNDGAAKTASVTVASGAFTLSGLPAGTYTSFSITVTGCTSSASGSRNLTDPTTATLTLGSSVNPSTCGGTNGSIAFTTSLADGSYTLNYNDGAAKTASVTVASGAFTLTGLVAGSYSSFSITVTGCTSSASGSRNLTDPSTATLTLGSSVNPTTCGGTNGSIAFTTSLADGSYTLNYNDGAAKTASITVATGAFTLSGLPARTYTSFSITVTGCTSSASGSTTLSDPSTATLTLGSSVNPSTCGGTNGSIAFTTTLADGTYTLNYSDGAAKTASVTVASGAFTLTGLVAGSYSAFSITVTGCTSSASGSRNLTDPSTATLTLGSSVNPTTCGGTNGSIAFTTTLADGTYTLNYNDGAAKTASVTVASGAFTLSGLPAGSYSSFAITVSGCTSSASGSTTLSNPTTATLTLGSSVNPSTCGGTNGSIAFTTSLADGSYTLNYNDGAAKTASITVASGAFTLSGLPAGTYTSFSITVSGCTSTASGSRTLTDPTTATLTLGSSVNPTTCGGTNGSIPFTTTLADGTYTLNYNDGAAKTASVTVASGAFTLSGLPAGTYTSFSITVTGCTSSASGSTTLSDPSTATLTLGSSVSPTTCGGTNGSIAFTTSLADGSYTLNYNDGAAKTASVTVASGAFTLSGLPAGTYTSFSITVTGCTSSASGSKTLTDPTTATLTLGSSVSPTTCGGTNGSVAFTTTLADGTYTLNYSDGAAKTASVTVASGAFTLSGLPAGTYTSFSITVTGCTSSASGSTTLSDPSTATLTLGSSVNPSTCGGTNGSIAFTTTLADGTYTLNYNDGAAKTASVTVASGAFTLSGLPAGSYSSFAITVSGCTSSASGSTTLSDPTTATLTLGSSVSPTTCGGSNGSIAFTTSLADGSYTLSYNDGAAKTASITVASGAFTLSGLPAGTYTSFSITVTGCTSSASGSKTLSDPSASTLTPGTVTAVTLYGGSDGSIAFTTTVPDGAHTLNYSFGGSPASASVTVASGAFTLTGLAAGSYTAFSITVSGCNATAAGPVVVTSPATHTLAAGSSVNPTVCSATDGSISFSSVNLPDGSYTLDYLKGGSPASASVSITSGAFTLSGLSAGSYSSFTITFNTYTNSPAGPVTLTDPAAHTLAVNSFSSPNTCGSSNGSITFLTSGLPNGTYSLSYTGSGSPQNVTVTANSFTLSNLPGGIYSSFSINNGGCVGSVSTPVTLSNPSAPVASVYADGPANFCKGSSVNLIASAGDSYLWNTGETTRVYNASVTGTYIVTVFYAGGCSSTASITVSATKCNNAPVAVCNSFIVPAGANCTATVTPFRVGSESYDIDGDPLTYSLSPAGPFSAGTHQVTMTVKDPFGASSSCTTTFHVVDETLPTVRTKNISVTLNAAGQATISPGDINNGSFDNCGIASMKISQNVFSCNDLGTRMVALSITDIHGHTSEGYANVLVSDKTAPVVKVKNISVKLDALGKASIKAADINDGSSDNCSISELSLSKTDFDCASVGPNNVTLTVKDAGGNTASAVAVVTIVDDTAPVAIAKNLTVYLDKTGLANITAQMADNGSSDNCGIKSLNLSHTSFICSDLGVKTVSLTVIDKSDNKTSVNFNVTVLDTIAPVVVTKAIILELSAEKTASLTAAQLNGGSSDNCGIAETTISKTAFSCSSLGVNKVRLTVKDASGNTSSALQEVIVTDPLGVCPCSYAVIAFDKVTLNRNKVNTGGIGIINSGKKVKLIKTLVNATGTFVKADGKDFDSESGASSYMKGLAPTPDPFRENTFNDKKKLKVKKGQAVTASEDHYGNIKVGKDATLTFSSKSDVFIKKLSVKKGARIVFGQQTFLVVRKKMSIGKEVIINEAGEDAKIFTGKNAIISKGAQVHASIHSDRNMTLRRSSESTPTQMSGLFVADKIKSGRHVEWNGTGTGCDDNKEQDQAILARKAPKSGEKKEITEPEKQLITEEIVSLELSAGPNPTNDRLDLLIKLPKETSAQLHLTDLNGRYLFSEQILGSGKTIQKQLSLGKFASGTYLLNLRTAQENKTVRIVKID